MQVSIELTLNWQSRMEGDNEENWVCPKLDLSEIQISAEVKVGEEFLLCVFRSFFFVSGFYLFLLRPF